MHDQSVSDCQPHRDFGCASFVSGALAGYFFLVEAAAQGCTWNQFSQAIIEIITNRI